MGFHIEDFGTHKILSTHLISDVVYIIQDFLNPQKIPDLDWTLIIIANGYTEYSYASFGGLEGLKNIFNDACTRVNDKIIYAFIIAGLADLDRGAAISIGNRNIELGNFLIAMKNPDLEYPDDYHSLFFGFIKFCYEYGHIREINLLPRVDNRAYMSQVFDFLIRKESLLGIRIMLTKIPCARLNNILTEICKTTGPDAQNSRIYKYAFNRLSNDLHIQFTKKRKVDVANFGGSIFGPTFLGR